MKKIMAITLCLFLSACSAPKPVKISGTLEAVNLRLTEVNYDCIEKNPDSWLDGSKCNLDDKHSASRLR